MNDPRTETHAMQQLKGLLEQHGLPHWWPILSTWLPNFDGWLATLEADESPSAERDDGPASEIVALLQQRKRNIDVVDDLRFADAISKLPFLCRRARLTHSAQRWSPFEMSYRAFAAIEPNDTPHVFESAPSALSVTKYWLLGKLFELQTERARHPLADERAVSSLT